MQNVEVQSVDRLAGAGASPSLRYFADQSRASVSVMAAAFVVGVIVRILLREHTTQDSAKFLVPWFYFAKTHGWGALSYGFTNYTPFYTYLLVAVTKLSGNLHPLTVVKDISFAFEFANACLLYALVEACGGKGWRSATAFAATWIAPTVIYNGAAWGQAESIWAFFDLLAILMFIRGKNGVIPFAVSVSVKAQGVFLGPFVLAMAVRRRSVPFLIVALPLVYLLLALPVFLAGRPVREVLMVYVEQGRTFHGLSMNAASIWAILRGFVGYDLGVVVGLALASIAGALLTIAICKSRRTDPLFLILAAACSLLMMPYLLLYEALGPFVEACAYLFIPVMAILGLLNVGFVLLFLAFSIGLNAALRLSALLIDVAFFGTYDRRSVLRLALLTLAEPLVYRPMLLVPRLYAFVEFLTGHKAHEQSVREPSSLAGGATAASD